MTEVQAAKYLENIPSRFLPVETIFIFLQFIEHGVIEILEYDIKSFSSTKHLDHVHQILMMQFLNDITPFNIKQYVILSNE